MRLLLLGIAWVGIVSLAGLASAQQSHLMIDPHPVPLSAVGLHEIRIKIAESAPDMVRASAYRVSAAIAAEGNPPYLRTPFRFVNARWVYVPDNTRGWRVYRDVDSLDLILADGVR